MKLTNIFKNKQMIPKIIHYVWIGDNPLVNEKFKTFYKSWEKLNPDYKIMLWNEDNIDFSIPYIKNAYANKKWANVSNLVRLLAVYTYGGIYLDTDVKVIKSFDDLLLNKCFFGFQLKKHETHWVNNAVFGAVKNHWFIKRAISSLLKNFDGTESADLSSPVLMTTLLKKEGLKRYSNDGILVKDIKIYPTECFYPYSWEENFSKDCIKNNTVAIHFWEKRWN